MIIDCSECEMYKTDHCKDCFVMAILRSGEGPILIDPDEEEAMENLREAGLAPALKFKRKAG